MNGTFDDGEKQDFIFWRMDDPTALASLKHALPGLLWTGKGVEIKCGSSFFCEQLGMTQLTLPTPIAASPGYRGVTGIPERFEANSSLEALQLDFVFICYGDMRMSELRRIFREAHRILKTNGVLVLVLFDPNSHAAESFLSRESRINDPYTVEQIIFELSNCGFKQFEFMQTLFSPTEKSSAIQEPKAGYGEGVFVIVQARKKI
jgi:hypothetical protein